MRKGPGLAWPCQLLRLLAPEELEAGSWKGKPHKPGAQCFSALLSCPGGGGEACGLGSSRAKQDRAYQPQRPGVAQEYTRGCACRCKHTCAWRCVPMRRREGQLLAPTMSPGRRICQTIQPDCHKPPAARRPSQRRFLTMFFHSPAWSPCSQELCSASPCGARHPCPAPHTSSAPHFLASSSGGTTSWCQALLGPGRARPVFSGF